MKKEKQQSKSIIEDKGKILKLIAVLVVLFTIVSYLTLLSIKILLSTFPIIQTLAIGNQDSWLLFFGSLFGGSLTLVALVITLKYSDDQRRDEKTLNLMPVCIGRLTNKSMTSDQIDDIFSLDIINVTENFTKDIKVESFEVCYEYEIDGADSMNKYPVVSEVFKKIPNILIKGDSLNIKPTIPTIDDKLRDLNAKSAMINISISYSDVYSLKKYSLIYTLEYSLIDKDYGNFYFQDSDGKSRKIRVFTFNKETNIHQ